VVVVVVVGQMKNDDLVEGDDAMRSQRDGDMYDTDLYDAMRNESKVHLNYRQ